MSGNSQNFTAYVHGWKLSLEPLTDFKDAVREQECIDAFWRVYHPVVSFLVDTDNGAERRAEFLRQCIRCIEDLKPARPAHLIDLGPTSSRSQSESDSIPTSASANPYKQSQNVDEVVVRHEGTASSSQTITDDSDRAHSHTDFMSLFDGPDTTSPGRSAEDRIRALEEAFSSLQTQSTLSTAPKHVKASSEAPKLQTELINKFMSIFKQEQCSARIADLIRPRDEGKIGEQNTRSSNLAKCRTAYQKYEMSKHKIAWEMVNKMKHAIEFHHHLTNLSTDVECKSAASTEIQAYANRYHIRLPGRLAYTDLFWAFLFDLHGSKANADRQLRAQQARIVERAGRFLGRLCNELGEGILLLLPNDTDLLPGDHTDEDFDAARRHILKHPGIKSTCDRLLGPCESAGLIQVQRARPRADRSDNLSQPARLLDSILTESSRQGDTSVPVLVHSQAYSSSGRHERHRKRNRRQNDRQ